MRARTAQHYTPSSHHQPQGSRASMHSGSEATHAPDRSGLVNALQAKLVQWAATAQDLQALVTSQQQQLSALQAARRSSADAEASGTDTESRAGLRAADLSAVMQAHRARIEGIEQAHAARMEQLAAQHAQDLAEAAAQQEASAAAQAAVAAAELADLQRTVQQLQEDKQVMLRTLVATEIELQRAASKPGSARCSAEPSQQSAQGLELAESTEIAALQARHAMDMEEVRIGMRGAMAAQLSAAQSAHEEEIQKLTRRHQMAISKMLQGHET